MRSPHQPFRAWRAVLTGIGFPGERMQLTVVIATRNRAASLRRTLVSLFQKPNCETTGWEAIVVDDGSSDSTPQVCASFGAKYTKRFRFFAEDRKGKSNALNIGIVKAYGEILAFTDDDVICAPDYIPNIIDIFDRYPVDAAQGRTLLSSENVLPDWLAARHREFLGQSDYGEEIQLSFPRHLTGANMVVRAAVARAIGGFAPELGPGTPVGFSEDTDFSRRLRQRGCRVIYAPQILVHHFPPIQFTKPFFRKRYFRLGRSRAYYQPYPTPLWQFGLYVAKNWIFNDAKALRYPLTGREAEALDCQCEARFQAGFFWQHFLFWYGMPRQLTQVTSWPKCENGESPGATFPPNLPQDCSQGLINSRIDKGRRCKNSPS